MTTLIRKANTNAPAANFSEMVDKIFQNNLNRFFADDFSGGHVGARVVNVPLNVKETEKTYELQMVAPGLKKEDFRVNVSDDSLTVSYDHKEEKTEENKNEGWLRKEYSAGSFSRTIKVDDTIDVQNISATYTNGILHVSLPKKENTQKISRNVEIA
jgi:HSP20 family protein